MLFAVIPQAEAARLAAILQEITTIEAALEVLGNPDLDQMARRARSEKDGLPPEVELYRLLVYQRLSGVADVYVSERKEGGVKTHLQGKHIGGNIEG